jgi:hypothetical protein
LKDIVDSYEAGCRRTASARSLKGLLVARVRNLFGARVSIYWNLPLRELVHRGIVGDCTKTVGLRWLVPRPRAGGVIVSQGKIGRPLCI